MVSCEYCESFENTFFTEQLRWLFLQFTGFCAILAQADQNKIVQVYFPSKSLLCAQGQYCTGNLLVHCCLRRIWITLSLRFSYAEAVVWRCSVKNVFLKVSQNSQKKHLCQNIFLNTVAALVPVTLFKKRPWHRYFPVNFKKFLRTLFIQNTSWRLLLYAVFSQLGRHNIV